MEKGFKENLIAPCGIDCRLCSGFLRDKNRCQGCNIDSPTKPTYCVTCIIKNCENIKNSPVKFCYNCEKYPCKRLKQLNKRYETKYNVHIFENFNTIKNLGMEAFLESEQKTWSCKTCDEVICMHNGICSICDEQKN